MQFKTDRTTWLDLLLIVAVTFISFGIVMTGYFIADDTWQLQFCYRVFHGEWSLVTGNFFRSYLSLPSMDFYRPLLGLTYLVDYALYGVNAAGFYLTNILLAALAGVILYFLALSLMRDVSKERARAFAICSTLMFVVSPLHCEDVCWISGRADLLAGPLYLGSLLAAVYARNWRSGKINALNYIVSLLLYALSLMSKEAAVTLPLVVAALFVLFPQGAKDSDSEGSSETETETETNSKTNSLTFWGRAKNFVLFLLPFGILTVAYLGVRQYALGDFVGGYTGDMGEALSKWLLFRWFDPFNFLRIAFPVSKYTYYVFNLKVEQTPTFAIIGTLYALIVSVLIVRMFTQKINPRLPLFLTLWLLASLIPLAKLWGLDDCLHNQRVLYLFTAPFLMFVPALLFSAKVSDRPIMAKHHFMLKPAGEEFMVEVCLRLFYVLTACLAVVTACTSCSWVQAGLQVKAIQNRTARVIEDLPKGPNRKMLVVSVSKDFLGAHVLMGGVNMLELLEPPFTKKRMSDVMYGFQRALVGPGEPISGTRLKVELRDMVRPEAYFWDSDKADYKVVQYDLPKHTEPTQINLPIAIDDKQAASPGYWFVDPPDNPKKGIVAQVNGQPVAAFRNLKPLGGEGLKITGLDINPLSYDYINLAISMPRAQFASGVYVSFDDLEDRDAPFKDEPQVSKLVKLRVPDGAALKEAVLNIKVSHFGQWYSFKKIRRMKISFSNIKEISVSDINISDEGTHAPILFVSDRKPRPSGEYFCDDRPLKFLVHSALVKGAKSALVQISRVNQSWDTFVSDELTGHDTVVKVSYTVPLDGGVAGFSFDPRTYGENGFYDVRVGLLNDKNERISDWSDIVTLYRPDAKGARAPFCADY